MKVPTYDEILASGRDFTQWNELEKFVGEFEPVDEAETIRFHRWLQRAIDEVCPAVDAGAGALTDSVAVSLNDRISALEARLALARRLFQIIADTNTRDRAWYLAMAQDGLQASLPLAPLARLK
jgi:hypothetical protein